MASHVRRKKVDYLINIIMTAVWPHIRTKAESLQPKHKCYKIIFRCKEKRNFKQTRRKRVLILNNLGGHKGSLSMTKNSEDTEERTTKSEV